MNQRDHDRRAAREAIETIEAALAEPTLDTEQRELWQARLHNLRELEQDLLRWTSNEIVFTVAVICAAIIVTLQLLRFL